LGYVTGYIIVTAFLTFVFLWPETHLVAFLGLAALLSLPVISEMTLLGLGPITTGGTVATLFVLSGIGFWITGPIPPPPPWRGWLQPANDPTPHNFCDNPEHPPANFPLPKNYITVIVGDHAFGATKQFIDERNGTFAPFKACNIEPLTITLKDNKISINAALSDRNGNEIGKITNSGYNFLQNDKILKPEHSGDLSTLVVHDKNGTELLFVRF
jgi:hypothetical protein